MKITSKLGARMFISEIKLMHLKKRIGKPYGKCIDRMMLAAELMRSENPINNY